MSKSEIMSEIPKLSHSDRRDILRLLLDSEEEAQIITACDQLAIERFQMLDRIEEEDATNSSR
jgi:hypothetical protein